MSNSYPTIIDPKLDAMASVMTGKASCGAEGGDLGVVPQTQFSLVINQLTVSFVPDVWGANVGADDDGAPEIAEENPLDQENQQAAEDQIVQNGVRRHADQRAAVVVSNDLDRWRQAAVMV